MDSECSSSGRETIYKSLDPRKEEFRLLVVHPGKGDGPIRVDLELAQFNAQSPPEYETISYCWGDPKAVTKILLKEREISVPASSARAVRCVRLPDRDRILWIDALCIDQENLDERAQQVAIMASIYSKSRGNLVYLGEKDSTSEGAVESIGRLITHIKERTDSFRSIEGTPLDTEEFKSVFVDDVRCNIDEPGLLSLFSRPWFRRVWAFQEAGLAPSNICFLGDLRFDLQDVVRVATWILFHGTTYSSDLTCSLGLSCASELFSLYDQDFGARHVDGRVQLSRLLSTSSELLSTEPHDHVYGLLGLWTRNHHRVTIPLALSPNYRKPIEHVFRDATLAALEEEGDTTILAVGNHRWEDDIFSKIPSWVLRLDRPDDNKLDTVPLPLLFKASCGWSFRFPITDPNDDDVIVMRGLVLDQVVGIASVFTFQDYRNYENAKKWVKDMIWKARMQTDNKAIYDAIAVTLSAGLNAAGDRTIPEDPREFSKMLGVVGDHGTASDASIGNAIVDKLRSALRFSLNRGVFVTQTGSIGLGPKLCKAGDIVVVVYGGSKPLVLRPCENEYRLVGECFFDGVMDGEAMKKHKEGGNPDIEFKIR